MTVMEGVHNGSAEFLRSTDDGKLHILAAPTIKDSWIGNGNEEKEFIEQRTMFGIVNRSNDILVFTIGNVEMDVEAGGAFQHLFEPFNSVLITATGPFRAYAG